MKRFGIKKENRKDFVLAVVMAALLFGLSFLCWTKEEEAYSDSERRALNTFPVLTKENVWSGKFMEEFEDFCLDQFPFRDAFRSVKALTSYKVFQKKDNNGVYEVNGHLSKLEYPLNEKMLEYAADTMENIYHKYLENNGSRCYFVPVPDKNYYLAGENGYLTMDYEALFSYMKEKLTFAEYIDITSFLDPEDYYKTDTHWRQERILDVAEYIKACMPEETQKSEEKENGQKQEEVPKIEGKETEQKTEEVPKIEEKENGQKPEEVQKERIEAAGYTIERLEQPFFGVYYGQAALPAEGEVLWYLNSQVLKQCKVTSYDTGMAKEATIYNMEKAKGKDPYEIFLSGASALQVIENPMAENKRELLVFRDSFGSSLVPLLVDSYAKITVIDIRYVQSDALGSLIDFHGQDTLFLYSTLILNNSMALR